MIRFKFFLIVIFSIIIFACNSTKESNSKNTEPIDSNLYVIQTKFGDMIIRLFDETPLHRDNFKKLVADSFYDGTLFHRVIPNFMIQGGDPDSKNAQPGQRLGMGNLNYTVPNEVSPKFIHKKGALAAAQQDQRVNPLRASSASQFYIVDGSSTNKKTLKSFERRKNISKKRTFSTEIMNDSSNLNLRNKYLNARNSKNVDSTNFYLAKIQTLIDKAYAKKAFYYSLEQIALYDSLGGAPNLDGDYTVFGEIIEGISIIDSIAILKKDKNNRPEEDLKMTIKKL